MKPVKENKRRRIQSVVQDVITAYGQTGAETDPLGMYTGVTREVREGGTEMFGQASFPNTKTPTDAILNGKIYCPPQKPTVPGSQTAFAEPVQDADDL